MDCFVECFVGNQDLEWHFSGWMCFNYLHWTRKPFNIYREGCAKSVVPEMVCKKQAFWFVRRVPSGFLLNLSCIIYTPEANWFIYLFRRWNNHHVWCSFLCAWLFSEGVLALLLFGGDETREGWKWRKKLSLTTAWSSRLGLFKGSLMWSGKRWCASDYSVWWHI